MLNDVLSVGMAYSLYSIFLAFPIFFSVSAPKRSPGMCACLRSFARACVRMSISSAEPVNRFSRNLVRPLRS
jgi:hypothetical protein